MPPEDQSLFPSKAASVPAARRWVRDRVSDRLADVSTEMAAIVAILLVVSALAISRYRVTLDNREQSFELDGFTLAQTGLTVRLEGALTSELILFEAL